MKKLSGITFLSLALLCNPILPTEATSPKMISFTADIWADNWFALYINGKKVGEDTVPITKEKSFNREQITFTATYPLTVGLVAKDYVQDQSGLEYIGTSRQQIGDGGIIAQIRESATKNFVTGTDASWKTLVLFKAPLNPECVTSKNPIAQCLVKTVATPKLWSAANFKDSSWANAQKYSPQEVGVKDGYLEVDWDQRASLVWSGDLKLDNTILLRKIVSGPSTTSTPSLQVSVIGASNAMLPREVTCDGGGLVPNFTWSGIPLGAVSLALTMETIPGPLRPGETDIGNHFYIVAYNIPSRASSIADAVLGKNFQGRNSYTAPCSQGPGIKNYIVTLYALSRTLDVDPIMDGKLLQANASKYAISKVVMNYGYSRS